MKRGKYPEGKLVEELNFAINRKSRINFTFYSIVLILNFQKQKSFNEIPKMDWELKK